MFGTFQPEESRRTSAADAIISSQSWSAQGSALRNRIRAAVTEFDNFFSFFNSTWAYSED